MKKIKDPSSYTTFLISVSGLEVKETIEDASLQSVRWIKLISSALILASIFAFMCSFTLCYMVTKSWFISIFIALFYSKFAYITERGLLMSKGWKAVIVRVIILLVMSELLSFGPILYVMETHLKTTASEDVRLANASIMEPVIKLEAQRQIMLSDFERRIDSLSHEAIKYSQLSLAENFGMDGVRILGHKVSPFAGDGPKKKYYSELSEKAEILAQKLENEKLAYDNRMKTAIETERSLANLKQKSILENDTFLSKLIAKNKLSESKNADVRKAVSQVSWGFFLIAILIDFSLLVFKLASPLPSYIYEIEEEDKLFKTILESESVVKASIIEEIVSGEKLMEDKLEALTELKNQMKKNQST